MKIALFKEGLKVAKLGGIYLFYRISNKRISLYVLYLKINPRAIEN